MLKRCEEDAGFRPSTVRQLLGSRKMTEQVLHFLMFTRVGQQSRAQEQGEEEQRSHRNEAWNLEEDRQEGDKGGKGRVGSGRRIYDL